MTKFSCQRLVDACNTAMLDPGPWEDVTARGVAALPAGSQRFWGVPFDLGERSADEAGLVVAGADGSTAPVDLPVKGRASYVVFAHFCDSRARTTVAGQTTDYPNPVVTAPGEHLADYILVYEDGSEAVTAIRRRFEINQAMTRMQSGFAARPHQELTPLNFRGPYPRNMWGRMQTGVSVGALAEPPSAHDYRESTRHPASSWSIYALENPHPDKALGAVRIEPTGAAAVGVGGVTLFSGKEHPLRYLPLEAVQVEMPEGVSPDPETADVAVDLGVIARRYAVPAFDPDAWLGSAVHGWGEDADARSDRSVVVDVSSTADATLAVAGRAIDMGELYHSGQASSADGAVRARVLTPHRTWVHGRIIDASTGKPTAARLHFRSKDGRYFPPYGHTHEVNDNWFEDYGADLKLGTTQYAYVDGTFQAELPVGEVYVEVAKGFEYEPIRARMEIKPGQRDVELRLERVANTRSEGWVTADDHVHFLSPETAHLEAQGEGLNMLHLLAAQWGDLFTNVGDLTGAASGSSRDDTIVWVGTENRQHFMGHLNLLAYTGTPVFPMSTSGPTEGYFGDPTVRAMSEWAEECREKGGVVIVPHFPYPHSEVIAEVVRGKVDGLEIRDFWTPSLDTFAVHEWYRLLNCGYRIAAIGGTDKMTAAMPVGGVRTYAFLGDDEFTPDSWGRAVKAGRTYTTSGPLMRFAVEGHGSGDEIRLPAGGGTLHVAAEATATAPIHKLEIVFNGNVVAQETAPAGARMLRMSTQVDVPGSGWLAARCVSEHKAWHLWPVHLGAHTSPVYVVAGNEEVFDAAIGEYLITVMNGGLTWLDTLATRSDPARHAAIRNVFEEGIARVRERLPGGVHRHPGDHGRPHSH